MDIKQPVIHDRHVVNSVFEQMKRDGSLKNSFSNLENLTIVTCRNKESMEDRLIPQLLKYKDKSILEENLEYLGVDITVLRDERLPWRCTFKFEMISNYLNSNRCKTEYVMFCDAIDVIFQDNPQKVLDIFHSFECDALFMSTHSTDGYNCMPDVKQFMDKVNGGNGRYLNSGVYIGKTEFIKEVIKECVKYIVPHGVTMDKYREYLDSSPTNYPVGSQDQDIFRFVEPKFYPRLKVDYQNLMAYRS